MKFKYYLLVVLYLSTFQLVVSMWPWPRSSKSNLHRNSNSNNWRMKNILAQASNKSLCSGDFYFLMDSSVTIGEKGFNNLKDYLKKVLLMFGPSQVQHGDLNVGLVRFSGRADILTGLLPPNNRTLENSLDNVPFVGDGASSLVRVFRLLMTPSLWLSASAFNERQNLEDTSYYRAQRNSKIQAAHDEMFISDMKNKRRRLIVVFTDGQFVDSHVGMTMATLGICREMNAPVVFVGIQGTENVPMNVHNLLMLAETPQHVYFLGPLATPSGSGLPARDDLSAWNLAAYLCYTLKRRD